MFWGQPEGLCAANENVPVGMIEATQKAGKLSFSHSECVAITVSSRFAFKITLINQ
jgi:hypothetical protein